MSLPGDERDGPDGEADDSEEVDAARADDAERDGPGPAGENEVGPPTRDEWSRTDESREPSTQVETLDESPGWRVFAHDVVSSVLAVLVVGAYLYAVSGVWPPLVAVESRSMTPNMQVNDLVFVMEADRFPGPGAHGDTGVVTARAARQVDYRSFEQHGDVIVYERDGNARQVPIIHRAMFWVEEGENWYDKADQAYITATECGDSPSEGLRNCPAPHAGFVTKGDSNARYDQVTTLSGPVRPEWVVGTAELRVPGLGWVRLQSEAAATNRTRQRHAVP